MRQLVCPHCSTSFKTTHSHKKYCSPFCQLKYSQAAEWDKKKSHPRSRCLQLAQMAKNRAKSKNLRYDIDGEFLFNIWKEQDGKCAISGIPFDLRRPEEFNWTRYDAPSLDRIDSDRGYEKDNVRLVCYQINAALQDYGLEHFLMLCKTITKFQESVS